MGSRFSCCQQSSSQKNADQEQTKLDNDDHNRSLCSVLSLLMLVCMWKNEAKEGQLLLLKEKQKQQQKQVNKAKEVTLEDWLTASPGLQKVNGNNSGGEYHVLKHYSSKRVFPSFVGENTSSSSSSSKARESFSKDKLLEDEEIEVSLSMSQTGKLKKRVSFKLPEEADIFIFHSSSSSPPGEESK